jgi:flagellar protein FlgJ
MNDSFRGYASPADSVAGYADFLLKNPRYKPMMQAQGLDAQLQALGASGYATDPNYANSVGAIARSLNLPGNAAGATEAMATGQPIPAAPTQVASTDPMALIGDYTPYAPKTEAERASRRAAMQPAMDQIVNSTDAAPALPAPTTIQDMPVAGTSAPPQQVAQAQPNPGPANLPVMAGGSADAIQPGKNGPSLQMLLQAAQNPWLNDTQKAVVQMMLKQKMDEQDPMRSLEMQYKRAQISKLTDPNARDKFGNSVIWGQDADGNWVAMQPSSGGGLIPAKTPEGIKLSPPGIGQMNLGTSFGVRDRNGNVVNTVPIDNAGKASETKLGENRGNLQASLPSDMLNTNQAISDIDALINNPGLDSIVGGVDQYRPSWMLGDQGRDAAARLNQIKGKTFLQAYATLKGGGSITEVEGKKAEDAIGRLDRAQDEKTFRAALSDLRDVIAQGQRVLLQKAGIPQDQWGQYLNGGDTGSSGTKRLKFNPATGELE